MIATRLTHFLFRFAQLGITDDIGDASFKAGQLASAENLNDRGTKTSNGQFDPAWEPAFKKVLHGVILITGDSQQTTQEVLSQIKKQFLIGQANAIIQQALSLIGDVRPGAEKGHEQFVASSRSSTNNISVAADAYNQFRLFGWSLAASSQRG